MDHNRLKQEAALSVLKILAERAGAKNRHKLGSLPAHIEPFCYARSPLLQTKNHFLIRMFQRLLASQSEPKVGKMISSSAKDRMVLSLSSIPFLIFVLDAADQLMTGWG